MTLDTFQLGEPVEHRGIVVTPLFPRRDPVAAYITLDEALPRGLRITETSDSGSVPELFVENPTDSAVLLYDGEELVGAKQNRILNVSVLVGAGAKLPIPVSCVEQGRWSRRSDVFGSAKHISHSNLRRRKAETLAAQPLAPGLAQGDVWDEVREKQTRMGVRSETAANRDTFEAHAARLQALESAFALTPGQCGAVLGIGDDLCLDAVSRPDAFALLWPKLRAGLPARRARASRRARDVRRADLRLRGVRRRSVGEPRPVGRARRGRAPARSRSDRLRARARRRDDPAVGLHERRRRRAGVRPDRPAEPKALTLAGGGGRGAVDLDQWIKEAPFRFAKTMPENPHWYVTERDERRRGFGAELRAFLDHVHEHGGHPLLRGLPVQDDHARRPRLLAHMGPGLRSDHQPQAVHGGRLG